MKLAIFFSAATGTPCLTSAISAAGCAASDLACQCGPTKAIIAANVAGCLITSCTAAADLAQAQSAGEAVCAGVSATSTAAVSSASATGTSSSIAITPAGGNSTVASTTAISGGTTTAGSSATGGAASVARTGTTTRAPPPATTSRASSTTKPPSANAGSSQGGVGAGLLMALLGAVVAFWGGVL
ncbi:hypothetical protein QBC34DRAFT_467149 [Podospora aff. communis PSN243]|uniref:CFEM domain-containing protein n=1 Tax=Podospora aff. communis PSN243 TaxID=3040156 RepID=A0AAV9GHS7_9PEZI|nr:hypothetical protein QBC34DRAFT_467149 [Podospora aff. communis PSN243]